MAQLDWIPVAVVVMNGYEGSGRLYVNAETGWQSLLDEILGGWQPPTDPTITVDPADLAPPFTVTFTAMTRGEFERLPEHEGW